MVLDEIVDKTLFFSVLFVAKCNPTVYLDLNTCLKYCYTDMAILNYAMYYQYSTGKDVTIFTHDKNFYIEALKYNVKVKYYPKTYLSVFENTLEYDSEIGIEQNETLIEVDITGNSADNSGYSSDDSQTNVNTQNFSQNEVVYYKTVAIQKVSSKPVIMNNNSINCIKSAKTLTHILQKGNKGFKYWPIELGDYVYFKNDTNTYEITSLTGEDNLKSINMLK